MKLSDGDKTLMSKTSQTCDPAREPIAEVRVRKRMFQSFANIWRDLSPQSGKRIHFFPKAIGITQFVEGDRTQPLVPFFQHEWLTAFGQALGIAIENLGTSILPGDDQAIFINGEQNAGRQTHKVVGVGQPPSLVEIVHTPNKAALNVAPGSEVLDVKIADRQYLGGVR